MVASARVCIAGIQLLLHAMGNCASVVHACISDKDRKLISPNPCKDVRLAKRVPKNICSLHQSAVPFLMAERVVDLLHAIEVNERNQEGFPISIGAPVLMLCQAEEH